jgi:hypothetical protein
MNKYPIKFCLFCETSTDEEAVESAKEYVKNNNLSSEEVRILKSDINVTVWTKIDGVALNG